MTVTLVSAPSSLADPWRWWVVAVLGALLLIGVCVLEARRPASAGAASTPRRFRRRWLVMVTTVAAEGPYS